VPKSAIAHKLPRVLTTKPQKASNKTITNTTDFRQLSTILHQRRRLRAAKKPKSTPSTTPVVRSQLRRSLRTRKPTSYYKEQANAVLDPITGKLLEYRDLLKNPEVGKIWYDACSKEFARLCNGRSKDNTKGTNSIRFKKPSQLSPGKKLPISGSAPITALKNPIPTASDSQSEEILSIMTEKPTLPHPISSPPKSS